MLLFIIKKIYINHQSCIIYFLIFFFYRKQTRFQANHAQSHQAQKVLTNGPSLVTGHKMKLATSSTKFHCHNFHYIPITISKLFGRKINNVYSHFMFEHEFMDFFNRIVLPCIFQKNIYQTY